MLKTRYTFQPSTLHKKLKNCIEISETGLVKQTFLSEDKKIPLVFRPTIPGVDLLQWADANRELIERSVLSYGGVLFRGFDVPSPEHFHRFARIVGESPVTYAANIYPLRDEDKDSGRAALIRPELRLKWHIDDSFDGMGGPRKIMFHSHLEAAEGGETPICDLREVLHKIDPELRRRFMEQGIVYVRNYYPQFGMDWKMEFGTGSPEELESICRRRQTQFEWVEGRLRTRCHRPAVIRHPRTGDMLWYNLMQMWHPACNEPGVLASWKASFQAEDYPMNVYFGDGTLIPDEVIKHIYQVYDSIGVSFSWQHADVMVLDNFSTAHARQPFKGARQLHVALDKVLLLDEIPLQNQVWNQDQALNPV
jgi:alpha-ketoglutarate-dependent taurine dioxygenase